MATETENREYSELNNQIFNHASILNVRLNTDPILQKIEKYLGVSRIYIQEQNGNVKEKVILGENAICNKKGAEQILASVSNVVNPQVVQGNFDLDEYRYYISNLRRELATEVFIHCKEWNIKDSDHEYIVNGIMSLIKPFISRLKFNKERDSYANTLRHVESNTQQSGGFKLFGKR